MKVLFKKRRCPSTGALTWIQGHVIKMKEEGQTLISGDGLWKTELLNSLNCIFGYE